MLAHVDSDVFFHLKDGARVLSEGRMPTVEDLSFTRAGTAMVAHEWLASAAFAAAYAAGGYPLVAALCALLLAGALFLLGRTIARDAPAPVAAALTALAALGLLSFAIAKVQSFTILLFALFLLLARRWEKGDARAPWLMAAAMPLWANLHGGFAVGLFVLGLVCALELRRTRALSALAPAALGAALCCVHPNGWKGLAYPFWFVFGAPQARGAIDEWTPLSFEGSALPYALLAGVLLASLRGAAPRGRFPWTAVALVLLAMGLRSRKLLPYFTLASAAAAGLSGLRADRRLCLGAAAACLLGIAAVAAREHRSLARFGRFGDFEREYPRGAVERLLERSPAPRPFHPYEWGAYMLWKGSPVFIDGRLEPYWTLYADYEEAMRAGPRWRELLDRHGVDSAVLPPGASLTRALKADPGWTSLGTDGKGVLFARRAGKRVE